MKKELKPIIGEELTYKLIDRRGVRYSPFDLTLKTPMLNPITWDTINEWEDGFYIYDNIFKGMDRQTLIRIVDNKVVEAYRLEKLEKGTDIIY
jgi:hypothetical protein